VLVWRSVDHALVRRALWPRNIEAGRQLRET
jgi:hypothetical protein